MSRTSEAKKLVSVLATSTSTTDARNEALECVFFIYYPVQFKDKNEAQVQVLVNSRSEVNAIHPTFAKQLGLSIRTIDVGAQKIVGTMLDTHGMVIAAFLVVDKANRVRFFEKTLLMANVSPEVVLGMLFLTLSNANNDFLGRELRWKTYTTEETLPTTRHVELVEKKEFAATVLDPEHETYIVYVASFSSIPLVFLGSTPLNVHSSRRPQISSLIAEKAPTKILNEYLDFVDVFSPDLTSELPKYTEINTHTIDVEKSKQLPYSPIYSLGPIELETLKTYIEINLANGFIRFL